MVSAGLGVVWLWSGHCRLHTAAGAAGRWQYGGPRLRGMAGEERGNTGDNNQGGGAGREVTQ